MVIFLDDKIIIKMAWNICMDSNVFFSKPKSIFKLFIDFISSLKTWQSKFNDFLAILALLKVLLSILMYFLCQRILKAKIDEKNEMLCDSTPVFQNFFVIRAKMFNCMTKYFQIRVEFKIFSQVSIEDEDF